MNYEKRTAPYLHLVLRDFLDADTFSEIKGIVSSLGMDRKDADLFSLEQSADLTEEFPVLKQKLLALRQIIQQEMNISIQQLDMSAMKYEEGDYLLCHDDQLEGRKVAYILYLAAPSKGGELLLRNDEHPYDVVESIAPKENLLVLFEVSPKSWHEVAEVEKGSRLSIGGWLH